MGQVLERLNETKKNLQLQISTTAGQMPRLLGLAQRKCRQVKGIPNAASVEGNETGNISL
jgi:hypothetical protein